MGRVFFERAGEGVQTSVEFQSVLKKSFINEDAPHWVENVSHW